MVKLFLERELWYRVKLIEETKISKKEFASKVMQESLEEMNMSGILNERCLPKWMRAA